MASPVRFLSGVTNAAQYQAVSELGMPDPFFYHYDFQDFDAQNVGDWTATKVGTGTNVMTAEDGGVVLLSTSAGAADSVLYQRVAAASCWAVPSVVIKPSIAGHRFEEQRNRKSD